MGGSRWARREEAAAGDAARDDRPTTSTGRAESSFPTASLEELLAGVEPLGSIDDLATDDLAPNEAASFRRAIDD